MALRLGFCLCVVVMAATPSPGSADQTRVIVPFGAGSVVDIAARIVFEQVAADLHEPFAVENKPGAGSMIGAALVARSAPGDATMLLATSSAHLVAPMLHAHPPYDPERDFVAVAPLGLVSNVLVVSSQRKIATLRQFVDWAHRHPVTFASLGVGSGIHMNALRFALSADISPMNVPFKGAPEALAEVMSGRIDFCFCAIGTALPYIRSGALTALAVGTKTRSKLLPDVPTTLEAGYAGTAYAIWLGVLASRNAPREHIAALGRAIAEAMKSQSVRTRLLDVGIEPLIMPAGDFEKFLANDREDNAAILKAAGLSMP